MIQSGSDDIFEDSGSVMPSSAEIDRQIKEGAKEIAVELAGPGGQIALDRVVMLHLDWFDLAQNRGMTWPQIVAVLHAAGAGRDNGLPFSAAHLTAVVWRQRQKAKANVQDDRLRSHARSDNRIDTVLRRSISSDEQSAKGVVADRKPRRSRRAISMPDLQSPGMVRDDTGSTANAGRQSNEKRVVAKSDPATVRSDLQSPVDRNDVRAAMRRAASLRRPVGESD